jgi:hypothetical protein
VDGHTSIHAGPVITGRFSRFVVRWLSALLDEEHTSTVGCHGGEEAMRVNDGPDEAASADSGKHSQVMAKM